MSFQKIHGKTSEVGGPRLRPVFFGKLGHRRLEHPSRFGNGRRLNPHTLGAAIVLAGDSIG